MSAAESLKSHLGNLYRSDKAALVLRFSVTLLLFFLVARTAADLTWQLSASLLGKGHPVAPSQLAPFSATAPHNAQIRATAPAEEIALFGQAVGTMTAPGTASGNVAPATNLNLLLKGVVAVNPMRRALAIIAERSGGAEQLYGQGEQIPGNAVIKEIHPDRVVLSRGGVLETLYLEGSQNPTATLPNPAPATTRASAGDYIQPRGDGVNWLIKQDYWEEKLADVPGLAKEVGVEVYSENNQQKGYRLVAVQNSKLLNTLGLLPGDILLSVNGRPMNNIQEGLAAYQQVKSGGQITIEINRNGHRESRVYNVNG